MTLIARSSLRATFRTSGRDATLEIDEQIGVDQCAGITYVAERSCAAQTGALLADAARAVVLSLDLSRRRVAAGNAAEECPREELAWSPHGRTCS